jgi:hypothetical protein
MWKRKLLLCIAPTALCLLDAGLTLVYQPDAYWEGRYRVAVEMCPPYHWLLQQHPLAFAAGIAALVAGFSSAILALPRRAGLVVSAGFVLGHTWGAGTWVTAYVLLGLFAVSALALVLTWEWSVVRTSHPGEC